MYLERWTLDEVGDSTLTLLRACWMPGLGALLPPSLTSSEAEPMAASLWSDEVDSVLARPALEKWIKEALKETSGQEARDLREGDVFTVESDEALPLDRLRRPGQTARFVRACREHVRKISDQTAQQRQVTGVAYRQLMHQASVPEHHEAT